MEFVTDRSIEDIIEAKELIEKRENNWNNFTEEEKEKWLSGMKAFFNYTDYNRIVSNFNEIEDLIQLKNPKYVKYPQDKYTSYEFKMGERVTPGYITSLINRVNYVSKMCISNNITEISTDLTSFNYETLNQIESNLEKTYLDYI